MFDGSELERAKFGCGFAIVFVFGAVYTWGEFQYFTRGRIVQADLLQVDYHESQRIRRRRWTSNSYWLVQYSFDDGGVLRSESDQLSSSSDPPDPERVDTVEVEYVPGSGRSRLKGNRRVFALLMFFASGIVVLGATGYGCWRFARVVFVESKEPTPKKRRRRRRRKRPRPPVADE